MSWPWDQLIGNGLHGGQSSNASQIQQQSQQYHQQWQQAYQQQQYYQNQLNNYQQQQQSIAHQQAQITLQAAMQEKLIGDAILIFITTEQLPKEEKTSKKIAEHLLTLIKLAPGTSIENLLLIYKMTKDYTDLKFQDKFKDIVND